MVFTRDELRNLIENPRTFRSLGPVIHRSDTIDYAEVGGEVYLTTDEQALRFRILPSTHERLVPLVDELREGRYIKRHFERLYGFAQSQEKEITNGEEWKRVSMQMWRYQNNGQLTKDAGKIAEEFKLLMSSMYQDPKTRRLPLEYICTFHVHNGGEPLSATDEKIAEKKPEIVVVYNRNYNLGDSNSPRRQVSLIYAFPSSITGLGVRRGSKCEYFLFGTYTIESVGRPVRAAVS